MMRKKVLGISLGVILLFSSTVNVNATVVSEENNNESSTQMEQEESTEANTADDIVSDDQVQQEVSTEIQEAYITMPETSTAEENEPDLGDSSYGYVDIGERMDYYEAAAGVELPAYYNTTIPSYYGSDNVTSVKNQNPYGTCWAFAALGAGESSMMAQGYDDDPDFSEYQFAYFFYHYAVDPLGNLQGDSTSALGTHYLNRGGNNYYSMFGLASWRGAADESVAPYENASDTSTLSTDLAYNDVAHMQNAYIVSMYNADEVKKLIMNYGGVATGIYMDESTYYNSTTKAYYQNESEYSNHGIMVVGWDDDYSVENFKEGDRPTNPGAWLIKNSWGNYIDYFWVSYEDLCVYQEDAFVFIFEDADNYDFNYQYDGACGAYCWPVEDGDSLVNVFTAAGASLETIDAVSIALCDDNVQYSVQIYLNPEEDDPLSGSPLLSKPQTGTTSYAGYYTIELDEAITIQKGDKFAVVFTLYDLDEGDDYVYCYVDGTFSSSWISFVSHTESNQMYYIDGNSGEASDIYYMENYDGTSYGDLGICPRIKAFTNTVKESDRISVDKLDVSVENQQYTGSAVTPLPVVKYNGVTLQKDVDYTLEYSNNTKIGNATITITGLREYTGSRDVTFKIVGQAYVNFGGICVQEQTTGIAVGAAYNSNVSDVQFQWKAYNLQTKQWEMISSWTSGNWTFWKPAQGNYWLRVEAKTSDGITADYTTVYTSAKDYRSSYINLNGYCIEERTTGIAVGVAYDTNATDVQFQWKAYNLQTKQWEMVSSWTSGNWTFWRPAQGSYWLRVEAKTSDGTTADYTMVYTSAKDYTKTYINLNGYCIQERTTGIAVGVAYDTNATDVQFQWKAYNLQTKQWEMVSSWTSGNWTFWKPEAGDYWLRVEVKTSDGVTADYTTVYTSEKNYK